MPSANESGQNPARNEIDSEERALRKLLAELGLTKHAYRDESLAPSVDKELLRSLIRRELPEVTARSLFRWIYWFRGWNDAYTKLLIEEFHRSHEGCDVDDDDCGTDTSNDR